MKRWWLRLAYFNLVLPLYRNRLIDLLCKSVDWFLFIRARSLVVSDLRSEVKGSRFESGC